MKKILLAFFVATLVFSLSNAVAQLRRIPDSQKPGWLDTHTGIIFRKGDTVPRFVSSVELRFPGSRGCLHIDYGNKTTHNFGISARIVAIDNDKLRVMFPVAGVSGSFVKDETFGSLDLGTSSEGELPIISDKISLSHQMETIVSYRPNNDRDNLNHQGVSTFLRIAAKTGITLFNTVTVGYGFQWIQQLEKEEASKYAFRSEEPLKIGIPHGPYAAVKIKKVFELELWKTPKTREIYLTARVKLGLPKKT